MVADIPPTVACQEETNCVEKPSQSFAEDDVDVDAVSEMGEDGDEDDKSVTSNVSSGSISYCGRNYSTDDFSTGQQVLNEAMDDLDNNGTETVASEGSVGQILGDLSRSLRSKFQMTGNPDTSSESSGCRLEQMAQFARSKCPKAALRVPPRRGLRTKLTRSQSVICPRSSATQLADRRAHLARSSSDRSTKSAPDVHQKGSAMRNLEASLGGLDLTFGLSNSPSTTQRQVPEHLKNAYSQLAVNDKDIACLIDNEMEFQKLKQTFRKLGAVTNGRMQQVLPVYVGNRRNKASSQGPPSA